MPASLVLRAAVLAAVLSAAAPAAASACTDQVDFSPLNSSEPRPLAAGCTLDAVLRTDPAVARPDGSLVTFSAAASTTEPGRTIVKYEWDLDGDGDFERDTGASSTTTYGYGPQPNRRVNTGLRITDDLGQEDTARVALVVTDPPTASVSADTTTPDSGETVTFTATASDPDTGIIDRYEWDLDGDGTFEEDTGLEPTATKAYAAPGPVDAKVRVTDGDGASTVATVTITVQNQPPIAAITGPDRAPLGRPVTFSASGSSDDGGVAAYAWDLDGDGTYEQAGGTSPSISHTFTTTGPKQVGVRVSDAHGLADTESMTLTVSNPPQAALQASKTTVSMDETVTFDASGSSDAEGGVTYAWDLDGDGTFSEPTSSPTAQHAYATAGPRTVRVRAIDGEGFEDEATVAVLVRNLAPTVTLSATPETVKVGETVAFDASSAADADGTVAKFEWDLDGDGLFELDTGTVATTTRSYPNSGKVPATVRVTDDDGGKTTSRKVVTVTSGGGTQPPPEPEPDPDPEPGPGPGTGTGGGGGGTPSDGTGAKPGGTTTTPPGGGPAGTPQAYIVRGSLAGSPLQKLRTARKRGVAVTCKGAPGTRCTLTLRIRRGDARKLKLGKRATTIGRATATVAAGATQKTVRVKLGKRARKRLGRVKRLAVVVRGTVDDGAGTPLKTSRTVLLR